MMKNICSFVAQQSKHTQCIYVSYSESKWF